MSTREEPSSASVTSIEEQNEVSREPESEGSFSSREQWDNHLQFLLSCVGLAVGIGNIWRFPAVAYENGGSAFVIPYLTCSVLFGMPMVYLEFIIGQFSHAGPGKAFKKYAPAFEGLGWSMGLLSSTVAVFYTVVIAWAGVYLAFIVIGKSSLITRCGNDWNSDSCIDSALSDECFKMSNGSLPVAVITPTNAGNYCYSSEDVGFLNATAASEEFFVNWTTFRSSGITDINTINWPVFGSLLIMWIIVFFALVKGIAIMGKMAYVTSTVPYVVVLILFFRGVTLPHAWDGVKVYLFEPDFTVLWKFKTWTAALNQLLFSLSVGYGSLIALASYSKPSNNCFRDTCIVIGGDTIMSLIGGVAVYSVLGYLSHITGREIGEVVKSGPSLAFIVYPEAISKMPISWLWNFLFFIMIFMLGISSEVAYVETLCVCFYDQFKVLRRRKWLMVLITCFTYFVIGILMVTDAGWYWFNVWSDFTGSTGNCLIAALEVIVLGWVYGTKNVRLDLRQMLGEPANKCFSYFGPHSPLWWLTWTVTCPCLAIVATVLTFIDPPSLIELDDPPTFAFVLGWFLSLGPLLTVPMFMIYNIYKAKKEKQPLKSIFHSTSDLPSYQRLINSAKDESSSEKEETKSSKNV